MKKLSAIIISLAAALGVGSLALAPMYASAAPADAMNESLCRAQGGSWSSNTCTYPAGQEPQDADDVIQTVINFMFWAIGLLCVVFIIWGGITYTMSRGDSKKVEQAKNTIMYAVIGLVVALIAYALVNWVFQLMGGGSSSGGTTPPPASTYNGQEQDCRNAGFTYDVASGTCS